VQAQEDGHFAVFVDGVLIAAFSLEAEAMAHCERLKKADVALVAGGSPPRA
jgi:hypothetical protein